AGDDVFIIDYDRGGPWGGAAPITIDAGPGNNTLVGTNEPNVWKVTGVDAGYLLNSITRRVNFLAVQNLRGGSSGDGFQFAAGGYRPGSLEGGGGVNALDSSAYAGDVLVSLPARAATGVGGAVVGVQEVQGGQATNVLVGDGTGNLLVGGPGRNLIITGPG